VWMSVNLEKECMMKVFENSAEERKEVRGE
jgi:hypothetical protein